MYTLKLVCYVSAADWISDILGIFSNNMKFDKLALDLAKENSIILYLGTNTQF